MVDELLYVVPLILLTGSIPPYQSSDKNAHCYLVDRVKEGVAVT